MMNDKLAIGIDIGDHSVKAAVWSNGQAVPVMFDGDPSFNTCVGYADSGM